MAGDTKWKKGDTVYAADLDFNGEVIVSSAVILRAGDVEVLIGRDAGRAFGYGTRFRQDSAILAPSAVVALERLNERLARAVKQSEVSLVRAGKNLAAAHLALRRARGEEG